MNLRVAQLPWKWLRCQTQHARSISTVPPKTISRFWKETTLQRDKEGFYSVNLDHRSLKTVGGAPLLLPRTKLAAALAILNEWANQDRVLRAHNLPITSLASRAIDDLQTPERRSEVASGLLKYLDTDTVCYHEDDPETLVRLQDQHWTPLIEWVRSKYDVSLGTFSGVMSSAHPPETRQTLGDIVKSWDQWKLAAFERAVLSSKSFLVGLALIEGRLDVDAASIAAMVEVQSQIERWGEVEDTHDVDYQDIRRRLGSSKVLII